MGEYARLLGDLKAFDQQEATLREAIAVGDGVLGPGTLTVADLTNDRAVALTSLNRHADAERAFRDSFERHVALFGENHWRVRNIARNVGILLALQRRHGEALQWMDRAVAIPPDADVSGDVGLPGIRAQRGWILFVVGRHLDALTVVSDAVSTLERMKDPNDGYTLAFSRILLARVLSGTGRPEAAEAPAREALAWFVRWGREHPKYADAECEVGRALMLRGQAEAGRLMIERGLPIYRAWGQADPYVVDSLDRLLADSRRAPE
jgi:tetratricopeptide (TPR) repeat protein